MCDRNLAIYCKVSDLLKAVQHREYSRHEKRCAENNPAGNTNVPADYSHRSAQTKHNAISAKHRTPSLTCGAPASVKLLCGGQSYRQQSMTDSLLLRADLVSLTNYRTES